MISSLFTLFERQRVSALGLVLSLAAVGLFNSVARRRARDAILLTYLAAIGYLALTGLTAFLKFVLGKANWLTIGPVDLASAQPLPQKTGLLHAPAGDGDKGDR